MKPTGKRCQDIKSLIHETATADEADFVAAFDQCSAERQLVKLLMAIRASQDKSQADVAREMDCTQSCVSKLESQADERLYIGEIRSYLNALSHDFMVVIYKKPWTLVDQIKFHARMIACCLKQLTGLAKRDPSIANGVNRFHVEALFNMVKIVADSAKNLPSCPQQPAPVVEACNADVAAAESVAGAADCELVLQS